jgi:hypothetical protein
MLSKFNLYDFIAVVVPGILFLWALGTFGDLGSLRAALPLSGGIAETSVLVAVGYVVGLLLQGVSQHVTERTLLWWWGGFPSARWLLPDDQRFTSEYRRELASALESKFGIQLEAAGGAPLPRERALKRNQEVFYRCYRFIEKLSDLPSTFNAQYGLFRALLTVFVILVLAIAARILVEYQAQHLFDWRTGLFGLGCLVGAVISYLRVKKRADDFARSVFDVFLAHTGTA